MGVNRFKKDCLHCNKGVVIKKNNSFKCTFCDWTYTYYSYSKIKKELDKNVFCPKCNSPDWSIFKFIPPSKRIFSCNNCQTRYSYDTQKNEKQAYSKSNQTSVIKCPNCQSKELFKNGFYQHRQRYTCKICETKFKEEFLSCPYPRTAPPEANNLEEFYEYDIWDGEKLNVKRPPSQKKGKCNLNFAKIAQIWLKNATKKLIAQNLSTLSYSSLKEKIIVITGFSWFLNQKYSGIKAKDLNDIIFNDFFINSANFIEHPAPKRVATILAKIIDEWHSSDIIYLPESCLEIKDKIKTDRSNLVEDELIKNKILNLNEKELNTLKKVVECAGYSARFLKNSLGYSDSSIYYYLNKLIDLELIFKKRNLRYKNKISYLYFPISKISLCTIEKYSSINIQNSLSFNSSLIDDAIHHYCEELNSQDIKLIKLKINRIANIKNQVKILESEIKEMLPNNAQKILSLLEE